MQWQKIIMQQNFHKFVSLKNFVIFLKSRDSRNKIEQNLQ